MYSLCWKWKVATKPNKMIPIVKKICLLSLRSHFPHRSFHLTRALSSACPPLPALSRLHAHPKDPLNNIPDNIISKVGRNLHHIDNHPLGIIKKK